MIVDGKISTHYNLLNDHLTREEDISSLNSHVFGIELMLLIRYTLCAVNLLCMSYIVVD